MRLFFLILLCSGMTTLHAQKYYSSYTVELHFNHEIQAGDLTIAFEKVVSESRCPKEVDCIRSGEAQAVVAIYRKDELLERKTLVFPAEGTVSEKNNLIYSTDEIRLMGVALRPYPKTEGNIKNEDYSIDILVN